MLVRVQRLGYRREIRLADGVELGRVGLRPGARGDDDQILGRIDKNRLTENSHSFVGTVIVHPPLETIGGLLLPRCRRDPVIRKYAGFANLTAAHEEQAKATIVP